jgi:hypothetical protein
MSYLVGLMFIETLEFYLNEWKCCLPYFFLKKTLEYYMIFLMR